MLQKTFFYINLYPHLTFARKILRYTTNGSKNMKILKTHTKPKGSLERY